MKRKTIPTLLTALMISSVVTFSTGCSLVKHRDQLTPDASPIPAQQVANQSDNSELEIEAGFDSESAFIVKPLIDSDPVPEKTVPITHLSEAGVFDAINLMASDAGLSVNIEGGARGSERYGLTSAYRVQGSLKAVLDQLAEGMGFFYYVKGNTLYVRPDQQFVLEVPPILHEDNLAGLTNTLSHMGARDVYLDRHNRSLVFRANKKSLEGIEAYMKNLRDKRSMIVYQINVFQVDLNDSTNKGINWNTMKWGQNAVPASSHQTVASTTLPTLAYGLAGSASGIGLTIGRAAFSLDALIQFLETQGTVKTIQRPRLAVLSGSKAKFSVGQSITYVSKVGTNVSTNLNQVTVETKDLLTGLQMQLASEYHDKTVYTKFRLDLSDLLKFNKFTALGTDLTLPQVASRYLDTPTRARPGDTILLAGITIDRNTIDSTGGLYQQGKSSDVQKSELVVTIQPKVVSFSGKKP